ncbi:MAG: metallophosphoesterase [Planctomycetes bacterium]|nr:metallophosphoesterase [Planctomycetota bacterium]
MDEVNLLAPDFVINVGDMVQGYNDTPEWLTQMREYKATMAKLACPWFPVVGNHDLYWRGKGPRPRDEHEADYESHFGPLWYAFRHKGSWFLALDSDEGDPASGKKEFNDPACQTMSPEQFTWLGNTLQKAKSADNVFVFLHHPRWLKNNYGDDWERVHQLLAANGNVRAVFAGHIHHMRYDGKRDGIEYFAMATVGATYDEVAPRAGYLHEYHVVTVRKDRLAVASFPVGTALDTRAITGKVSDETRLLAQSLTPHWKGAVGFAHDRGVEADLELELANPTTRALEVTGSGQSEDARWAFTPEHQHLKLEPGESKSFRVHVARAAGGVDDWLRVPRFALNVDYLGEGWRVGLPERLWELPLELSSLPLPARPEKERVLAFDGAHDALLVESAKLALPDGPLTLEAWFRAKSFGPRTGLATKTESSEFGLFASEGHPTFSLHLGGKYVTVESKSIAITPAAWHHIAGVYDGQELRLYLDGARIDSKQASGKRDTNALPLVVGGDVRRDGTPESFFDGELDEVRLSSVARYSGERCTPARRLASDADTRLWLPMDGLVGPWIPDHSGRAAFAVRAGAPHLSDQP